ncbi:MAG: stage 0 sporulation protein [Nitrospirae bacterium]|nr:MAG: stage 0 sporulation protein [Nitrospirota bacterium]
MPDVMGIRFKKCGKIYDFEVNGSSVEFKRGDTVIVESELGLSIGNIVTERHPIENPAKELRKVLRKANEDDLRQKQNNENFEKESRDYCLERITARGLPMKLVCTEATLDKKRIIFYFTAEGRIDFREIVKDLAAKFKTRIEMRQIGVRDEAKVIGGFGMCGRELCCKTFLTSFEPVSIKMAKQQDLVLNMSKLSGICGRLMCCLGYEVAEGGFHASENAPQSGEGAQAEVNVVAVSLVREEVEEKNRPEVKAHKPSGNSEVQPPPPAATAVHSDSVSNKEVAKEESPEQKTGQAPPQGHKKRKKWRWRKFHKQDKPENK